MHTIKVLAVGFVLLGIFVLIGRALGHGSRAAALFSPGMARRSRPESLVWSGQGGLLRSRRVPYLPADLRCSLVGGSSHLVETPLAISRGLVSGPGPVPQSLPEPVERGRLNLVTPHFPETAHYNRALFGASRFTRLTPWNTPAGRRSANLL